VLRNVRVLGAEYLLGVVVCSSRRAASSVSLLFAVALCGCGGDSGGMTPTRPSSSPLPVCPIVPPKPANLESWPCPTLEDIASSKGAEPIFEVNDPGPPVCRVLSGSGPLGLTAVQERYYQSLSLMRRANAVPFPWTGGRPLIRWFQETVQGIRFRSDISTSYCCEPEKVINIAVGSSEGQALSARTIPLWPLETLVHEARHIEVGPHTCGTRDETVGQLGAFGVQYELVRLLSVDSASPLSTEERALAAVRAAELRRTAFCSECR
jgi:hypothetical protein